MVVEECIDNKICIGIVGEGSLVVRSSKQERIRWKYVVVQVHGIVSFQILTIRWFQ